jgi:hypothetical protein
LNASNVQPEAGGASIDDDADAAAMALTEASDLEDSP